MFSIRKFLRVTARLQLMPILESGEETLVGGQAVMEGVMMRAPHSYCVAVRKAIGRNRHRGAADRQSVRKISDVQVPGSARPGHAGPGHDAGLSRSQVFGQRGAGGRSGKIRAVRRRGSGASTRKPRYSPKRAKRGSPEISSWMMTANLVFSLGFFIFLYKFVPLFPGHAFGQSGSVALRTLRHQHDRRRHPHGRSSWRSCSCFRA